ncbi:hypothetical protein ACIRPT_27065 [Streptomyces sp. NPDC101227]|uniref:hypothetical protein n=1 Tax=Streptomyces sp. NPDC101227 TaxID=3366136 RepID=UPI0037FF81C8
MTWPHHSRSHSPRRASSPPSSDEDEFALYLAALTTIPAPEVTGTPPQPSAPIPDSSAPPGAMF